MHSHQVSETLPRNSILYWVVDENHPSYDGSNLGRATVGAAKGLLAKVYLTRASYPIRDLDSYQLAYDKAKEVINDAHYSLAWDEVRC